MKVIEILIFLIAIYLAKGLIKGFILLEIYDLKKSVKMEFFCKTYYLLVPNPVENISF